MRGWVLLPVVWWLWRRPREEQPVQSWDKGKQRWRWRRPGRAVEVGGDCTRRTGDGWSGWWKGRGPATESTNNGWCSASDESMCVDGANWTRWRCRGGQTRKKCRTLECSKQSRDFHVRCSLSSVALLSSIQRCHRLDCCYHWQPSGGHHSMELLCWWWTVLRLWSQRVESLRLQWQQQNLRLRCSSLRLWWYWRR